MGAGAAPRPVFGRPAKTRALRVRFHMAGRRRQMPGARGNDKKQALSPELVPGTDISPLRWPPAERSRPRASFLLACIHNSRHDPVPFQSLDMAMQDLTPDLVTPDLAPDLDGMVPPGA